MWWQWLFWWRPPCLLRTVDVHLKHDTSIVLAGVLWHARGPWLVLRNARVESGTDSKPADGEIVIHRSDIAFLHQVS